MTGQTQKCEVCGEPLTLRGGLAPRFCPRCGKRLTGVTQPATRAANLGAEGIHGAAIASLVFGVLGLGCLPVGMPFGALSFFLGLHAHNRIVASNGRFTGKGMAIAGMVLGLFASLFWAGVCAGVM